MWRFSIGLLARKAVSAATARRILNSKKGPLGALTGVRGGAAVRSLSPAMRKRLMELLKIREKSSTPHRRRSTGGRGRSRSSARQSRPRRSSARRRTNTKTHHSKPSARRRSISSASLKRKKRRRSVSSSRKRSRRRKKPTNGPPSHLNSYGEAVGQTAPVTTPMIAMPIHWPGGGVVGSRNAVPLPNSSAPPVAPRTTPGAGAVEVCGGSSSASISDPPPRLHYLLATAVATVVVPIIANDMLEGMRHVVTKASREMDPARAQKNGNQTQQIEEYYMSNKGPLFATAVIAGTNAVKLSSTLLPLCHPVSIQKCSFTFRRRTLPQTARPSALPHRVILRKRTTPPSTIVPRRQEFSILYCFCTVATNEQKVGGVEMEALSGATAAATTMYDMLRHLPCAQEDGLMLGEAFVLAKRGGRSDFIKLLMSETELPPQTTTTTPLPARPQITPSPPPTPPPSSSSTVSDRGDTTPNSPPKPEATVTLVSSETNESSVVPKSETPLSTPEQQESIKSKEAHQEDNETEVQAVDESNSEELEHVNDEPAVAENRQSNNTLSSPRPITVASSINKRARAPAPPVDTSIPKPAPPSSRGLPPIPRSGGPSNGDVVSWWQSTPQERRLQEHNPRRRYGEGRLSPITLAEKKMRKITKDDGKASTADDHGEVEEVPINASPSSSTGKRVKRKKVVKIVRKAALRSQSPQIPDYTHDEDEVTHTNPPGSTGKTATSNAENNVIKDNKDSEKKARANAMKKEKHHPENEGGEGKKKKKKTSNGIVTPAKSEQTVKKSEKSKSSGRKREENQNSRGMEELEDGEELYTTVDHSDWDTLTTTVVEEDVEEEGHGSHTKEKRSTNLQDEEEEDFIPPPPREKPMVKKRGR